MKRFIKLFEDFSPHADMISELEEFEYMKRLRSYGFEIEFDDHYDSLEIRGKLLQYAADISKYIYSDSLLPDREIAWFRLNPNGLQYTALTGKYKYADETRTYDPFNRHEGIDFYKKCIEQLVSSFLATTKSELLKVDIIIKEHPEDEIRRMKVDYHMEDKLKDLWGN